MAEGTSWPVAIASDGRRVVLADGRSAWWSDDGASWTRAHAPPKGSVWKSLVATPRGFVALAKTGDSNGPYATDVYTSVDGTSWQLLPHDPLLAGFAPWALTYGSEGLLALGRAASGGVEVIRSSDFGSSWSPIAVPASLGAGTARSGPATIEAEGSGYVVFAPLAATSPTRCGEWYAASASSPTFVTSFAPPTDWPSWCVSEVVRLGSEYLAVGNATTTYIGDSLIVALASADGRTWRPTLQPPAASGMSVTGATAFGDSSVLVGYENGMSDERNPKAWRVDVSPAQ